MKKLNVVIACSTKEGLKREYAERLGISDGDDEPPPDYFAEGDDPSTIQAVADSIRSAGHKVEILEASSEFHFNLVRCKADLVFNIAEGLFGDMRESFVPMICERIGIPYTGSGPLSLGICLNKSRTKEILAWHGIQVAPFKTFSNADGDFDFSGLKFPLIIKPVAEGSSKGIFEDSYVSNPNEASARVREKIRKYCQPVIAEEFLPGEEFTAAVWGNGSEIEVLPLISIKFDKLPPQSKKIYSYEAKWLWDTVENPVEIFECPARINSTLAMEIKSTAIRAYIALDIKDWCRIDIRLDRNNIPNIIELNPLPGILPRPEQNSCFPKAARAAGYSYEQMINKIIGFACGRYGIK